MYNIWISFFLIVITCSSLVICVRKRGNKIPLIDDNNNYIRHNRSSNCLFGESVYELEEKWKPNLGPPFGLLSCVRCECISVQRKNRIVAKVKCKNIINDCSKPKCDNPILLPGRCCKICPGEETTNIEDELALKKDKDKDDDEMKEFSVLIVGSDTSTNVAGRGYLYFVRRNLHYTVRYSEGTNPNWLRFTDEQGNILEEIRIVSSPSKMICGVWSKFPRVYRRLLRKGKFFVTLVSDNNPTEMASGKVVRNNTHVINEKCSTYPELVNTKYDDLMDDNNISFLTNRKCIYEDKLMDEGFQWKSFKNDCEMCSCQRGRIKCERIVCPKLECNNIVTYKGDCCPTCSDNITEPIVNITKPRKCFFEGDKKYHTAGSKWYPYLPPFGFDFCSLCTCKSDTLRIKCIRVAKCPPLTCAEEEAFRENTLDCCKRCPMPVKTMVTKDHLGDQIVAPRIKTAKELIAAGGCVFKKRVYPNGDEWHPYLAVFGEYKCIKCRCENMVVRCRKIKCPNLECDNPVAQIGKCCKTCGLAPHNSWKSFKM